MDENLAGRKGVINRDTCTLTSTTLAYTYC